jgi:hypothetical protein
MWHERDSSLHALHPAVWSIWLNGYGRSVKTTLNLDDDLMRAARDRARRDGVTLTALISDALRKALAEPAPAPLPA